MFLLGPSDVVSFLPLLKWPQPILLLPDLPTSKSLPPSWHILLPWLLGCCIFLMFSSKVIACSFFILFADITFCLTWPEDAEIPAQVSKCSHAALLLHQSRETESWDNYYCGFPYRHMRLPTCTFSFHIQICDPYFCFQMHRTRHFHVSKLTNFLHLDSSIWNDATMYSSSSSQNIGFGGKDVFPFWKFF